MRIGFDAKRAYFNLSGLGNYSRNIIYYLSHHYPENEYLLYAPRRPDEPDMLASTGLKPALPKSWISKRFPSFWRSFRLPKRLEYDNIDLFHGLSNEIPFGIHRYHLKTVVTIHDLIFMKYPQWYGKIDRIIYTSKSSYSCRFAHRIIATSEQTRSDIISFFNIDPEKIDVIYQGCDPRFYVTASPEKKQEILTKYNLTPGYILYVGTIEKRKNLLQVVKAIHHGNIQIPLVVVGRQTPYVFMVKKYIHKNHLENVTFLENVSNEDLPPLYQMASLFIYPSTYEGFGIPILEALYSLIPVITTSWGCFPEAGGNYSAYIDPENIEQMSDSIKKILSDEVLRKKMIDEGYKHALKFNDKDIAKNMIRIYRELVNW
jgi:glycosyltransferase involved in cell wall biosynthesis